MANTETGRLAAILLILGLVTTTAAGEVYKYQDGGGRWHFSDRPPAGAAGTARGDEPTGAAGTPVRDLAGQLREAFAAATELERATLAVVGIETPLGRGAGFFFSADGYILTNRHVVRPAGSSVWQEVQARIDKAQQQVGELGAKTQEVRERLTRLDTQMQRYRDYLAGPDVEDRLKTDEEYQELRDNRGKVQKRLSEMERLEREASRRLRTEKVEFEVNSTASTLARDFRIVLKDRTNLRARLVSLSEQQDLALLKLDGYTTPAIEASPGTRLSQGQPVYAVGSPLGMADAMTSGVVTRVDADHILTDTQLLPGNSGGPLIDAAGMVLGVNVAKRVQGGESAYTQGFGMAIPIALALRAFPELRKAVRPAVSPAATGRDVPAPAVEHRTP